jgi:hypothetical protein
MRGVVLLLLLLLHLLQRRERIRQRLGLHFCHGPLCGRFACGPRVLK